MRRFRHQRAADTERAQQALERTRRQQEAVRPLVDELRHRADQNRFAERFRQALGGGGES